MPPELNPQWLLPPEPGPDVEALARETGLPLLAARIMHNRGYRTPEQVRDFLDSSPARLTQPDLLPDIRPATERVLAALERRERICIHGDYDVDGVAGTVLLLSALRSLGADVVYYLPQREHEGYGFSLAGVEFCREQQVGLIITTDCGSTDHETVAAASAAGIETIITDHHEPPATLPPAVAVVNPKRPDSSYPFAELAGSGVAFKLAWSVLAALGRPKSELVCLLDLVGLGTIADVVPLVAENRILARVGLEALDKTSRPGIRALMKQAGIGRRRVTSWDVSFVLAPRLNAAGRVGHARMAAELLLSSEPETAARLAAELEQQNQTRQALEEEVLAAALRQVEDQRLDQEPVIIAAAEAWSEGVIGIVASRLVERYYRPAIVVSLKDGIGKGSGRSIEGFNLYAALESSQQHLLEFGGHQYAAGLRLQQQQIPALSQAMNRFAASLPATVYRPSLRVDAVADLKEIDDRLTDFLQQLDPFGPQNPVPVFASLGLEVVGYPRRVGKNHLAFKVRSDEAVLPVIAWGRSHELTRLEVGRKNHDICYTVNRRRYAGQTTTQLTLCDLRTGSDPPGKPGP